MKAPAASANASAKPPLHQMLDSIPPQYVAMAASHMQRLAQNDTQPTQGDGPYKITDPGEWAKWDESLAQHGAIHLDPKNYPSNKAWDEFYDHLGVSGAEKEYGYKGTPEYFNTPEMRQELKSNGIDKQDLPDGGIILRKLQGKDLTS